MSEKKRPVYIKIKQEDNVAITVDRVSAGSEVMEGVVASQDIPQGHKIALCDIPAGGAIVRYGVVLGYAIDPIAKGQWINEKMLTLPTPPEAEQMQWGVNLRTDLPKPARTTWEGYRNAEGFAGTRNLLGIVTTVQCVAGVLDVAVKRIKEELLPQYPNVDGVVAVNHAYGCGVAIDAPEAKVPIRSIANICKHPNFGGELMIVGLGCEKLTVDKITDRTGPDTVLMLQDYHGFAAQVEAIMAMAKTKLEKLNQRRRETLPLSDLIIGMQCGGSDAFSGITANSAAGYASDLLISAGATVLFSEVTEVRDGVYLLGERTVDESTCRKLGQEMLWYDRYLEMGGVDRSANPTPGNKKGGLSNIVEKAMGSIAKSGSAPIVEVLSPGERPTKKGLIFAATPASDIVCGPSQLASGITLQVFMTGRGTPYGLEAAPVVKVSSRTDLKEMWPDLIDINAGTIATGDATIEQVGTELFDFILDVASGKKETWAEHWKLYNYMCFFNPAPIT